MEADSLKEFKSFKDFFIRKLHDSARVIEDKENPGSLWSPCDGTVFSIGTVEDYEKIVLVKGTPYKLTEFLFGTDDERYKYFSKMVKEANRNGNELKYMLIYLSPGDYHRYHSPAQFAASYRRHIAGYLHSVAPKYVRKHPNVFKENERVLLYGKWLNGFFSMSFIGATNVGSISLNFDRDLKMGLKHSVLAQYYDKNYLKMTEDEIKDFNKPTKKKKKVKTIQNIWNEERRYEENEKNDSELHDNIENAFKAGDEDVTFAFHINNAKNTGNSYYVTSEGVRLDKGQEIGYFNMGSSILLLFEAPKSSEFLVEEGDKLQLGNLIFR
jgi:phosphatidylserine decarboxylase